MSKSTTTRACLTVGAFFAVAPLASANMIINGSFESNTVGTTAYNMSNGSFTAGVTAVTGYGAAAEIDLMENSSNTFGLAATDGIYKLGIHTTAVGGSQDEFTFDLSSGITAGTMYTLSFMAHAVTDFDPGLNGVEVGISSSPSSFGTLVYSTGALGTAAWGTYGTTFTASVSGTHLSVRSFGGEETWSHIDAFDLEVVPEPATMVAMGAGLLAMLRLRKK